MLRSLSRVTSFLLASAPGLVFAKVVVFPVQATNLDPANRQAVGALLAQAYQAASGEATVSPRQASPVLRETDDYGAAAKQLGANEYVATDAVGLGNRIIITATRYTVDGRVIHTAKMTADGIEDVEVVSERLARALVKKTSTERSRTISSVSQGEGRAQNRVWVEKLMGIKASGDYWIGYGVDIDPTLTISFDGRLEGQGYFLEFGAGFLVSSGSPDGRSVGGLTSELGASFYLMEESASPYLGVGVLPRILAGDANLAAYAQGGVMLMRESSSRIYFDVRASQSLLPIRFEYWPSNSSGLEPVRETSYPTELSLNAGIAW
jgi:hypothetical protein